MRPLHALWMLLLLASCGGTSPGPSVPDAGSGPGHHADGGAEADAGELPDAGSEPDGGAPEPDAGVLTSDLVITGIRLTDAGAVGKRLRAKVLREADGTEIGTIDEVVVMDGQEFRLDDALEVGVAYRVHLYIDFDDDGACDVGGPAAVDRGWSLPAEIAGELRLQMIFHTTNAEADVCAHFR